MSFLVKKSYEFSYAHRLVFGYPDKCKNIHGHTGIATISLRSKNNQLDHFGFVRDFSDFKNVKHWIDQHWDHAMLISAEDHSLKAFLNEGQQKYYEFPHNPTSEWMAKTLFDVASAMLNSENCEVVLVEINESCTSLASFSL